MPGDYLPPVVIQLVLDDRKALAGLVQFKAAMKDASSTVGTGSQQMSKDLERAGGSMTQLGSKGKAAEGSIAGSMGNMRGAVTSAGGDVHNASQRIKTDLESVGSSAVTGGTRTKEGMDKASGAVGTAEKDIEGKSGGFSSRMGTMFSGLGNTMGKFGLPFGGAVGKMGGDMKKAESGASSFGSVMSGVAGIVGAAILVFAAIGIASIKAADAFDVANARLKGVVTDLHENFTALQPSIQKVNTEMVHLGFTTTETEQALGTLTLSTKNTAKAEGEMGVAADLARYKHISLAQSAEVLTKVNAGNNRALLQLGINLDLGNAKLAAVQKATEAAKKAKENLKSAEEALTAAVKKGAEEHKAALEKVTSAQEGLKSAQETLIGGSEGLTSAQHALKEAQKGVIETSEKEKEAVKQAAQALKAAEEAARETAISGAKGIEGAKKNLTALEQERSKEGNEAAIKAIEQEEKVLEAVKTAASEGSLVTLRAKKASLEATDKAVESGKKEAQMQDAHKSIIEAEATAHKNNKTAISAVAAAHQALIKKQKEALSSSKESVAAADRVTQAQHGVAAAERTVANDQGAVMKATKAVSTAQAEANKQSAAVVAAEAKVAKAHEAVSKTQQTLQKDSTTTQKVIAALTTFLHGQASEYTQTLAGKMSVLKAEMNAAGVEIGHNLMPMVIALMPAIKGLAVVIKGVALGVTWFLTEWKKAWEAIGLYYYEHVEPLIKKVTGKIGSILKGIGTVISEVVKFFVNGFGKILTFFTTLPSKFIHLAKSIGEGIWEGIKWGLDKVAEGLEAMLHAIGLPGFSVGPVHFGGLHPFSDVHIPRLAQGAVVTSPTLALIGESGKEAVLPLDSPRGKEALGQATGGKSGLHVDNINVYGGEHDAGTVVNELYFKLRPMLLQTG